MAFIVNANHTFNKDLYNALMNGEEAKVIQLCRKTQDGPLHKLTIHNDTVLHMATYSKQKQLVLNLLNELHENQFDELTLQNDIGNTILHEAATSDRIVPAAREMLRLAPALLRLENKRGETALFRAARYGKNRMFEFLDEEVKKIVDCEEGYRKFHIREDETTILHISILSEHFDLALWVAKNYEYLLGEKDEDGMTGLQLLACNSSAFESGSKQRSVKRFIYSCVSTKDVTDEVETSYRVPLWEEIRKQKQRYESALELAKFLIARDTSWEHTESAMDTSKPKSHKYGVASTSPHGQGIGELQTAPSSCDISTVKIAETPLFLVTKNGWTENTIEKDKYGGPTDPRGQGIGELQKAPTSHGIGTVKIAETPLFLATKSGCTEIVEEILRKYPQAVEHVDAEGRNILHVAIKYRQIQIFDIVEKMEIPMMRLIRKIDNNGNSILHMVGVKVEGHGDEDMRSPALVLREDLLLLERVQKISTTHFIKHFNSKGQTAEQLFADSNADLRNDAKEWLKRTAENCSIVAVLIATVAFAAAYTVPGGPNQNTGYPILLNQPFFIIFTLADVLSLTFALTSVITFLSILTSSFRLKDFKQSLPQKLMLGVTLLILSVSMMMFAFAATVILLIRNNQQWTQIALYSVAFFPVTIFAFSYLPLYVSLMKTFKYSLKKIGAVFPRCKCST